MIYAHKAKPIILYGGNAIGKTTLMKKYPGKVQDLQLKDNVPPDYSKQLILVNNPDLVKKYNLTVDVSVVRKDVSETKRLLEERGDSEADLTLEQLKQRNEVGARKCNAKTIIYLKPNQFLSDIVWLE